MFSLLRRVKTAWEAAPAPYATPGEGRRVYAIGDVHGCRDLLVKLMTAIRMDNDARKPAEVHLVLLGDLVDRGPDSAGVIDYVLTLSERWPQVECLMGNHEEVFLRALQGSARALGLFRTLGRETLLSYGLDAALIDDGEDEVLLAAMGAHIPESHREFLQNRPDNLVLGDYCFVHAGIRPGVPLEEQDGRDMRWIRSEFLKSRLPHSHIIVHGHSISDAVDTQPWRIGIDTGAYTSSRLSAIGLEGTDRWVLST